LTPPYRFHQKSQNAQVFINGVSEVNGNLYSHTSKNRVESMNMESGDFQSSLFAPLDYSAPSKVELGARKRFVTDPFIQFSSNSKLGKNLDDSFHVNLFSELSTSENSQARLRSGSLSLPSSSMSSAFGTPMFSSVWEPNGDGSFGATQQLLSLGGMVMDNDTTEEPQDISAITSTIGYLGLDDPDASAAHTGTKPPLHPVKRTRSISFPQEKVYPAMQDLPDFTALDHTRSFSGDYFGVEDWDLDVSKYLYRIFL
jgi:hypothetical protein